MVLLADLKENIRERDNHCGSHRDLSLFDDLCRYSLNTQATSDGCRKHEDKDPAGLRKSQK